MSMTFPPLPPPDAAALYVGTPQGQLGPLRLDDLVQQHASGQLPPDAAVWYDGLPQWVPFKEHPELRALLAGSLDEPPAPAAVGPVVQPSRSDDELDRQFGELIKGSWDYFNANQFAHHVDEVFIGAVITSTLDGGFSLIDLTSDGTNHYLRFQQMEEHTRILYQLHHLARSPAEAKVLGHVASVTIGYGERVSNLGRIWGAVKAEYKSGYLQSAEPGTVTIDADLESGYIYAQIDLFWNITDYVDDHYQANYAKLGAHIGASIHALRKYLHGRIR